MLSQGRLCAENNLDTFLSVVVSQSISGPESFVAGGVVSVDRCV